MRWLFRSVTVGILGGVATTVLAMAALGCAGGAPEEARAASSTAAAVTDAGR